MDVAQATDRGRRPRRERVEGRRSPAVFDSPCRARGHALFALLQHVRRTRWPQSAASRTRSPDADSTFSDSTSAASALATASSARTAWEAVPTWKSGGLQVRPEWSLIVGHSRAAWRRCARPLRQRAVRNGGPPFAEHVTDQLARRVRDPRPVRRRCSKAVLHAAARGPRAPTIRRSASTGSAARC